MARLALVVAAAGRGSRFQWPGTKTLYPVDNRPILLRILAAADRLNPHQIIVVVSPDGLKPVATILHQAGRDNIKLVVQEYPAGMADATLIGMDVTTEEIEHVCLIWGDMVNLRSETLVGAFAKHRSNHNDVTIPVARVCHPYVHFDYKEGAIRHISLRRRGDLMPEQGWNDCGTFFLKRSVVQAYLKDRFRCEYGFEYQPSCIGLPREFDLIPELVGPVAAALRIEVIPMASPQETLGLNRLEDLESVDKSEEDSPT